jgi:hypothetical protein
MARNIRFVIEGDVNTQVTVTENEDGTLTFHLMVLGGGLIGDLRGLFFDLEGFDADAGGLTATSTTEYTGDVSGEAYGEESVDTVGGDANVKGTVSNELGDFDVGIEFGSAGISEDDIQETSFVLAWDFGDLTLDMLDLSDFGIRYTSVGEAGGSRTGSTKISDQSNGVADNDALDVDENGSTSGNLLDNDTNGSTNLVVGAAWEAGAGFTNTGTGLTGSLVVDGKIYGTVTILADGTVTITADGADVDALEEGETVEATFNYTTEAMDGSLASADATVTIHGASDASPILADPYNTLSVGTTGGTRLLSVGTDGTMTEFHFAANNGGFAYGSALGDINGDGELDVLMSGDWSGAVIHYGDGSGGFTNSGEVFAGQFQSQVSIADIDNDGDGDIYLQNGRGATEVWRNDGSGFTRTFTYDNIQSGGAYRSARAAEFEDVNGDGFVDMLIMNTDPGPIADALFLNDGAGNFTEAVGALPTATGYGNGTLADVNGDGAADYVRGTASGIAVVLNDGSGNFTSPVSDLGAKYDGYVALADFNGDGFLDAVRSDPGGPGGIGLWLGDGTDNFVFSHTVTTDQQSTAGALHVGDFSGDGIADLLYATPDNGGAMVTMVNDGAGNFVETDSIDLSGYIFGTDIGLL